MSIETCDVLVIGGGPAGSTCARQLREAGLDVLLMDKRELPRDKFCAGRITPLDHYQLRQSGVRLALAEAATSIVRAEGGWLVNRRILAAMLVGAGGQVCPVACMLGNEHSHRRLYDEGAMLVGDAAGLAYPGSGEGIRPAVESALIAAGVIGDAAADYSRDKLAPYAALLDARFGAPGREAVMWLLPRLSRLLAARCAMQPGQRLGA